MTELKFKIDDKEINIKKLTILTGDTNTGKTKLSKAIYNYMTDKTDLPSCFYIYKDIYDTICSTYKLKETENDFTEILNDIRELIQGELKYECLTWCFYRDNGEILTDNNIPDGIKHLWSLQRLLVNNKIVPDSFIVYDKPESFLHPNCQLKIAKILVKLAKAGVYVFINTYSPLIIEAIENYSKIEGLENDTQFYLITKSRGLCNISRNYLYLIYNNLGRALGEIV